MRGSPEVLERRSRRLLRAQPPSSPGGWKIYASDGGARNQGTSDDVLSASEAVVYGDSGRVPVAMAGRLLGEVSNNVAEYDGLQLALGHAILHPAPLMRFRVDSMLIAIAKQVTFKWRCLAPSLITPYEETLALLAYVAWTMSAKWWLNMYIVSITLMPTASATGSWICRLPQLLQTLTGSL